MKASIVAAGLAIGSALSAAPGKLVIHGETIVLTHVYARRAPQSFDEKKSAYYLLAVDRELSPAVRVDEDEVRSLVWDNKLNGIEIELSENSANWMLKTRKIDGSISGSRSPNPFQVQFAGNRAKGVVKPEGPSKAGGTTYSFEFEVDAPVEVKTPAVEPTAADKAEAKNSSAAKAYLTYLAALLKGDKVALMKSVDPEKAKMIDTPEFPKMLAFIQEMQPKNIEVVRAVESGDNAELTVLGDAGKSRGTVKMSRALGGWRVVRESWKQ